MRVFLAKQVTPSSFPHLAPETSPGPAFPSYPSPYIFLTHRSITGNPSSLQEGQAVTTLLLLDTELFPWVPPHCTKQPPICHFPYPVIHLASEWTPQRSLCEKLAPTLELAATLPIQKLRFQLQARAPYSHILVGTGRQRRPSDVTFRAPTAHE